VEVVHDTPFVAGLDAIIDRDGSEARVAVLKATYELDGRGGLRVADEQEPIEAADRYMGEAGRSSTLYENDGAYFKPSTDIVACGSVYSRSGRPVRALRASLRVGRVSKSVAVFGDRSWSSSVFGIRMSRAAPFTEMPICWERSFGGEDERARGARARDERNPIGTGYRIRRDSAALDGLSLPNFEDPGDLIRRWSDRPTPHGFGFVGRSWQPRVRYAGTYDQRWENERMPIPPLDFDYRFFNGAPPGLVYPGFLQGGEPVHCIGLSPRGEEAFELPSQRIVFRAQTGRRPLDLEGNLDTVVFMFDRGKVIMVWRARWSVRMDEAADRVVARVSPGY
jgi:hypothetical protein